MASPAWGGQEWRRRRMNYVYILRSQNDNKRYIGLTNNLKRRLEEHNSGRVKATRNRRPFVLEYYEEINDRSDAAKREKFLKTGKGREFLDKLNI